MSHMVEVGDKRVKGPPRNVDAHCHLDWTLPCHHPKGGPDTRSNLDLKLGNQLVTCSSWRAILGNQFFLEVVFKFWSRDPGSLHSGSPPGLFSCVTWADYCWDRYLDKKLSNISYEKCGCDYFQVTSALEVVVPTRSIGSCLFLC